MKKLMILTLGVATIWLCGFAPFPPDTGEAIVDGIYEETSTNPPPHEKGQEEFGFNYKVKKGDTIWKIANFYHVDFHDLLDLNTHFKNPNLIYPNDQVVIPHNQVQGIEEAYINH